VHHRLPLRYRQAELVHCRWAMLGVAGVLAQEILKPDVFWYEAGLPENLPGPFKGINMGGLLAWEFLMMHFVEVRRWQDIRNHGSVNEVRTRSSSPTRDSLPAQLSQAAGQRPSQFSSWRSRADLKAGSQRQS
jgi:hypothetical protein